MGEALSMNRGETNQNVEMWTPTPMRGQLSKKVDRFHRPSAIFAKESMAQSLHERREEQINAKLHLIACLVIMGTSTGFGRLLAEEVLKRGERVTATARNGSEIDSAEQTHSC